MSIGRKRGAQGAHFIACRCTLYMGRVKDLQAGKMGRVAEQRSSQSGVRASHHQQHPRCSGGAFSTDL